MTLEIKGVDKFFAAKTGVQHVLRNVDLTVEPGEFVTFIGHSGCGKSTLLNVVAGLLRADRGEVLLDGAAVTEAGPDRAMVFQHYSLLPWMTLFENVHEAVRSARPDLRNVDAAELATHYLDAVGLAADRDKRPDQVSGGMKQRTAVARAFAVGPRVLLLDEPFGALDPLTRARLQDRLVELWSGDGTVETVLMVTHGLDEAIFLADRIVVMGSAPLPSIIETIDVPISRPRDKATIVHEPAYQAVYDRLMRLLVSHERERMPA